MAEKIKPIHQNLVKYVEWKGSGFCTLSKNKIKVAKKHPVINSPLLKALEEYKINGKGGGSTKIDTKKIWNQFISSISNTNSTKL
jgi:hypothetical protein